MTHLSLSLTQSPALYDGWTIRLAPVDGEEFDMPTRTALVNPEACGPKVAIAHVSAHIALRHHLNCPDGVFSETQEMKADVHAQALLAASAFDDWPAVDGDPTVRRATLT